MIELSVIMPCLNESETVGACIDKARTAIKKLNVSAEIIVADNGSTDGSQEVAKKHGAQVVTVNEQGYGAALSGGIAAARGTFVIMGDADDSYDFSHIPRFLESLREGHDLVMGNRFAGGIQENAMPALHKYLGNPALSFIGRLFFGSRCRDFHCGLRGFRRKAILDLDLRTTGMEFASEMVVKATISKLKIAEVPTVLRKDGRSHPPHLRSFRDGWRHLRFMLLFSPRWLFFYPGVALMALGALVMAFLLVRPQTIGGITFDVHTMLYSAAAVLIGFQAILFSVLSKTYAMLNGLIPYTRTWKKLFGFITLEVGLTVGLILFIAGIGLSLWAVSVWSSLEFGSISGHEVMRIVTPAVLSVVLGCQIFLASFFMSVLGLQQRK